MIDNKSIVPFIKSQIAKHISDSDSMFPAFVEAYYEWLNQPNNAQYTLYTLSTVTNIDKSIDKFTDEFFAEYLSTFPRELLTDKSLTIKHIADLYKAKGTPAAYKLLFKILYNDKIDIIYPSEYIFKPSDNKWIQDFTFFVAHEAGDIMKMVGEEIFINSVNGTVRLFVERIKYIRGNFYQIYIDKNYIGTFIHGDKIYFDDVICTVLPTTTKINIKQKGSGFKVGNIFYISDGIGYGSAVKVSKVDATGGILAVTFIEYGAGYSSNFDFNASTRATTITDTVVPGLNTTINDYINSIIDSGYLIKSDYYASDYIDPTNIGEILSTFYSNTADVSDPNSCIFSVEIGTIAKYIGYYESNRSFPSDTIYLQDGYYYQSYSYVIKSEIQLSKYKDILLKLIHPAGYALFGQYEILNTFNVGASLQNLINAFKLALADSVLPNDILSYVMGKELSDTFTVTDLLNYNIIKVLEDSAIPTDDLPIFNVNKALTEILTATDFIGEISSTLVKTDNINTSDTKAITTGKVFTDSAISSDVLNSISIGKVLTDVFGTTDLTSLSLTKILSDVSVVSDTATIDAILSKSDSVVSSDSQVLDTIKSLLDNIIASDSYSYNINKVLTDAFSVTDNASILFGKFLSDDITASDTLNSINTTKALNDVVTSSDVYALDINTVLSDLALSDDIGYIWLNPYVADSTVYFAEEYIEGITAFT